MTDLVFDADTVRRQAGLLDDAAGGLTSVHLELPDTGTVCDRTEAGLLLVEHRTGALADEATGLALALRALAVLIPGADDAVARRFGGA